MKFGERLTAAMAECGQVCVGIDPHASLLASWGLPDTAEGVREFSLTVVRELAGQVPAVKPQSAFYERHGAAGISALEETLAACRDAGLISILDVKRGDIGSTMGGYADAYLRRGAPLEADAITVSPYLGAGSLTPAADLALENGKGLYVLTLTSNPEGASIQHAGEPGQSVARRILEWVGERNVSEMRDGRRVGSIGCVIGATVGSVPAELGLDLTSSGATFLAPGVGAQGGTVADLHEVFGANFGRVLASVSRSVLSAGPGGLAQAAKKVRKMFA